MSVAIVPVKITCGSRSEEVVALYTTACGISSMSERLAEKLGITQREAVRIRNAGTEYFGHLPDRVTYVECSIHRASIGSGIVTVPVAFLIMPFPYDELVLGGDWSMELQQQVPQMAILSGRWDNFNMPELSYLQLVTGFPTRGPGFNPDCECSICHIIVIGKADRDALQKMVQDEKQRDSESLPLTSG